MDLNINLYLFSVICRKALNFGFLMTKIRLDHKTFPNSKNTYILVLENTYFFQKMLYKSVQPDLPFINYILSNGNKIFFSRRELLLPLVGKEGKIFFHLIVIIMYREIQ